MDKKDNIKEIIDLFEEDNFVDSKKALSKYIKEHKKQYLADKIGLFLDSQEEQNDNLKSEDNSDNPTE